eukprot:621012-Rhodomonas_salina.1
MRRQSPAWVEKRICCRCWSERVELAAVLGGALARAARLARIMVWVRQGGEKTLCPMSRFFPPSTPPRAHPWDVTGAQWRSADALERKRVRYRNFERETRKTLEEMIEGSDCIEMRTRTALCATKLWGPEPARGRHQWQACSPGQGGQGDSIAGHTHAISKDKP